MRYKIKSVEKYGTILKITKAIKNNQSRHGSSMVNAYHERNHSHLELYT